MVSAKEEAILEKGLWTPTQQPQANSSARIIKRLLHFVTPTDTTKLALATPETTRTPYFDGLRGFAALLVYFSHHQLWAHEAHNPERILENGFGYDSQHYFACLPGIRIFFSGGHFSVTVFFMLSGYVLASKPLALVVAGDYPRLGDNLSSALFRRWLRLNIPVICTTFLYLTSWHLMGYRADTEPQSTYKEEILAWCRELKSFTFIFRTGGVPWLSYNYHVWSIPVEFKGSVIIYTSLMTFSRCTRKARLWCQVGLIFYLMYIVDGALFSLFVAGMLLCDLNLLAAANALPWLLAQFSQYNNLPFYLLFAASIYLGGCPAQSRDVQVLRNTPGWHYLSYLKPAAVFDSKWFYLFWASTFLVASIPRISWLKWFFETRFNQHMGRISFAFYLVHGPLLWSLGDRVYAAVGWARESQAMNCPRWINLLPLPKFGPFGLEIAFWLPQLLLLPTTLWLAEVATRLIDEPSVRFAQWLYKRTLPAPPKV